MRFLALAAAVAFAAFLAACDSPPSQPLPLMGFAAGSAKVDAPKPAPKPAKAVSLSGVAYATGGAR